jgi:hypothetical protein
MRSSALRAGLGRAGLRGVGGCAAASINNTTATPLPPRHIINSTTDYTREKISVESDVREAATNTHAPVRPLSLCGWLLRLRLRLSETGTVADTEKGKGRYRARLSMHGVTGPSIATKVNMSTDSWLTLS